MIGPGGQVGFQVGRYDHGKPLVIDPVLSLGYSTYLGGAGAYTKGFGIAVDSSGDAYVTGVTLSPKFPTTKGAFQTSGAFINTIGLGAFVTKFNAAGSALVYSTFLGGISPAGIAVDSAGDAYVTGSTYDAPPLKNAFQATAGGGGDAFVTKLNATGSALVYSTYLGGGDQDYATGIAVDGSGDAYVTGDTVSTDFPTTPGSLQPVIAAAEEAFVIRVESRRVGPGLFDLPRRPGETFATGIAVDRSGNAYVTGWSPSSTFATTPGAFTVRLLRRRLRGEVEFPGSALVYAAQLADGKGSAIAVDGSGNAYVTGIATAPDFPTTAGAFQTTFGTATDAFVTELNAAGTALVYSTRLGGSGGASFESVFPGGVAVDGSGNIHVTGITGSSNFPTKDAVQAAYGGGQFDAFVAEINPSQAGAASLVYSTYLGGGDQDEADGIAVDGSGNAYVTGFSFSLDFPTKNAYQPQRTAQTTKHASIGDAFVTKITFN